MGLGFGLGLDLCKWSIYCAPGSLIPKARKILQIFLNTHFFSKILKFLDLTLGLFNQKIVEHFQILVFLGGTLFSGYHDCEVLPTGYTYCFIFGQLFDTKRILPIVCIIKPETAIAVFSPCIAEASLIDSYIMESIGGYLNKKSVKLIR